MLSPTSISLQDREAFQEGHRPIAWSALLDRESLNMWFEMREELMDNEWEWEEDDDEHEPDHLEEDMVRLLISNEILL